MIFVLRVDESIFYFLRRGETTIHKALRDGWYEFLRRECIITDLQQRKNTIGNLWFGWLKSGQLNKMVLFSLEGLNLPLLKFVKHSFCSRTTDGGLETVIDDEIHYLQCMSSTLLGSGMG